MRRLLVLAFLLAAGCARPGPVPEPTSGPIEWGIDGCAFAIVAVPVDEAALRAHLPEGFELAPSRLGILPAGPRATIELDAYQCRDVTWSGGSIGEASYGSYYTAVRPPDALREDGYDAAFVKWDVLVADGPTRDRLVAEGLPAHAGDATVSIQGPIVAASLRFDEGGGFVLTGTMGAREAQGAPLPFVEFTPLQAAGTTVPALARWHARLHDASIAQGTGVVELEPGWVRDLVGSDRAPATFIAGIWNLDEADLTLPIEWP